jgi:hypothetical protein
MTRSWRSARLQQILCKSVVFLIFKQALLRFLGEITPALRQKQQQVLRTRSPGMPGCPNTLPSMLSVSFGRGHEAAEEPTLDMSRPITARNVIEHVT